MATGNAAQIFVDEELEPEEHAAGQVRLDTHTDRDGDGGGGGGGGGVGGYMQCYVCEKSKSWRDFQLTVKYPLPTSFMTFDPRISRYSVLASSTCPSCCRRMASW